MQGMWQASFCRKHGNNPSRTEKDKVLRVHFIPYATLFAQRLSEKKIIAADVTDVPHSIANTTFPTEFLVDRPWKVPDNA